MKKLIKGFWFSIFEKSPRTILGNLLYPFMTARVQKIMTAFFVARMQEEDFLDRCLRAAINDRYYNQDEETISWENRTKFWGASHSRAWHEYHENEAARDFAARMKFKMPLVTWIKAYAKANDLQVICEVGTGMGHFLFLLREEVVKVSSCKFVGLDLNQTCIDEANKRNQYQNVTFLHGDVEEFISEKGVTQTLFVFYGTLEYFPQKELERTLELIKGIKPAAIAISEPINLDLASEFDSRPRGNIAFSHNYVHLFDKHGYRVVEKKIEQLDPEVPFYEMVMMLIEV
jgi:2-polyprenyl-3-methyl-5-hydroxy-6-metoxy-1,4-benzoquinol methylase